MNDKETTQRTAGPTRMLNKVSDDWMHSWLNYLLLVAALFIFIVLELIKINFDVVAFFEKGTWLAVLTKLALQAMILFPMVDEGQRSGLKADCHVVPKEILTELLSRIRKYGHTNKFNDYLKKYNKTKQEEWLEAQLGSVGLELYDKKRRRDLTEFLRDETLKKDQIKKIKALIKVRTPITSVSVSDFYSTLPIGGKQDTLRLNVRAEKFKLIFPRMLLATSFALLGTLMLLEVRNADTWTVFVSIVISVFTICSNTLFGFLGGRRISIVLFPLVFNNRIAEIKSFAINNNYFTEYDIVIADTDKGKEEMLRGNYDNNDKPSES